MCGTIASFDHIKPVQYLYVVIMVHIHSQLLPTNLWALVFRLRLSFKFNLSGKKRTEIRACPIDEAMTLGSTALLVRSSLAS
jgi:hypothetical protein